MVSVLVLERPTWRHYLGVALLLGACFLPPGIMLCEAIAGGLEFARTFTPAFTRASGNSLLIAAFVSAASLTIGLPLGVLIALYQVPGRKLVLSLLALPLLLPPVLPALGWSALAARLGSTAIELVHTTAGCVIVFCAVGIPLVLLMTLAAGASMSSSPVQAARLAGGECSAIHYTLRYASVPAMLAAVLAGVLSVSDPGPGQILGVHTAGAEILTTLSAQYDFALAGRQCAALAVIVLLVTTPMLCAAAPRFAAGVLARQTRPAERTEHRAIAKVTLALLLLATLLLVIAPLTGLLMPLLHGVERERALAALSRTGLNTIVYAGVAGVLAALVGLTLALLMGRSDRSLVGVVAILVALFVLPPALGALGILRLRGLLPDALADVLNTRFSVGLVLALRLVPIAAILMLRGWRSTAASTTHAAALHGVPLLAYLRRVTIPVLLPGLSTAVLLAGLLATSDIVTVLLLHPPGEANLPLVIFTVMANAPESLVASLCMVQTIVVVAILSVLAPFVGGGRT